MEYGQLNQLRLAFVKQHGAKQAEQLMRKRGGKPDEDGAVSLDSVPQSEWQSLAADFQKQLELAGPAPTKRHAATGTPRSLEEIAPQAWDH